jgi:hypothetical protein
MLVVPGAMPVSTPPVDTIVPTATLLLVHTPPLIPSVKVTDEPTHTLDGPPMAEGDGATVTVMVAKQPVLSI